MCSTRKYRYTIESVNGLTPARRDRLRSLMVHVRSQVLVPALVVGTLSGVVGVVYLAVLHVLSERIGPSDHGAVVLSFIHISEPTRPY